MRLLFFDFRGRRIKENFKYVLKVLGEGRKIELSLF